MKTITLFFTLMCMMVISFSSCQKAKERPAKPNPKLSKQLIAMNELSDIKKIEGQSSAANVSFKKLLIAKMTDEKKRDQANKLLEENRLGFEIKESKVIVYEVILKTETTEESYIKISEIAAQVGVLENEITDYNEKKSTQKLTETSVDKAQYIILKEEIKADASGDDSK